MKNKIILFIACAVVIGGGSYLWTQVEYYREDVNLGPSFEATLNPYLAAEKFLQSRDLSVESRYQLDDISNLDVGSTLFISNANHVLNERRADALIEWLEKGGHIIIAAQVLNSNEDDVFLSRFDVKKYGVNEEDTFDIGPNPNDDERSLGDQLREANRQLQEQQRELRERELARDRGELETLAQKLRFRENRYADDRVMTLSFDGRDNELRVLTSDSTYLDHPSFSYQQDEIDFYEGPRPYYSRGTDTGISFMRFTVGEGLLTVIGDSDIWTNDYIGLFDHAYLLRVLTQDSNNVVFLRGAEVPSLFELIWQHYRELCVVLALLLLAWLLYRGRRFGPIVSAGELGRRSYREHLSAVGNYYWRHNRKEELRAHARMAVWRTLNKKYYSSNRDQTEDKLHKLADLCDLPVTKIHDIMLGDIPQDEYKFFQMIKALQTLRKQL